MLRLAKAAACSSCCCPQLLLLVAVPCVSLVSLLRRRLLVWRCNALLLL
jgi:hypothetical protein